MARPSRLRSVYRFAALSLFLGCGTTALALAREDGGEPARPNIVLVMADDLAWADVGYNGAEFYETPHIDALARDGVVFDRAYASGPNCSPTRACVLTGTYVPRYHVYTPGARSKGPARYMRLAVPRMRVEGNDLPSRHQLYPQAVTIAEVLGEAGYTTARLGKWHLGPDDQGFDVSDLAGDTDRKARHFNDPDSSAALARAAARFIEEHADVPFFLFVSLWDPHLPLAADPETTARYADKLERTPGPWNPEYAAMVEAVDRSVGTVRAALEEHGLAERTLFIFASDNGGESWLTPPDPLRSGKGSLFEGGIRVPTCMAWPGRIEAGSRCDTPIVSPDFMPTFAELAGVELDASVLGSQPVDGVSLVPLLDGSTIAERSVFWFFPHYLYGKGNNRLFPIHGTAFPYWRAVPAATVMRGPWKLTRYFEDGTTSLFDVVADPGERDDRAQAEREIVERLSRELGAWLAATEAPVPQRLNPAFTPPSEGETPVPPEGD